MLVKEVLEKSNQFLKSKGIETPRLDAELIIADVLKLDRISLYLKYDQPLQEQEIEICRQKIVERGKGLPVAYIIKKKYFYNYEFYVDQNVLIPRPETELLVEQALQWIADNTNSISILDMGCGSGCIIVSMVAELQKRQLVKLQKAVGIDLSGEALSVAQINANQILKDPSLIQFLSVDAATFNFTEKFDLILANPPYIATGDTDVQKSVHDFEPHKALYASEEGLSCVRLWLQTVTRLLKPKGLVIFEIGNKQGLAAKKIFAEIGIFSSIEILKDYSGFDRFIKAVRNG